MEPPGTFDRRRQNHDDEPLASVGLDRSGVQSRMWPCRCSLHNVMQTEMRGVMS